MRFEWFECDGGYQCKVSPSITLSVSPDSFRNGKARKGAKWRAYATHWNEATRTASKYGRDEYLNLQDSAKKAMSLAEEIYETRKPGDDYLE